MHNLEGNVLGLYLGTLVAGGTALLPACATPTSSYSPSRDYKNVQIMRCELPVEVDDGDGIFCTADGKKESIRILGIDTAEIEHLAHCIPEDQPFGREGQAHAQEVFGKANEVVVYWAEKDRYGRVLGHVFVDGQFYALGVLEAGLAYESVEKYGDNGFPGLAALILQEATKHTPKLDEDPRDFRRRMRKKYGVDGKCTDDTIREAMERFNRETVINNM